MRSETYSPSVIAGSTRTCGKESRRISNLAGLSVLSERADAQLALGGLDGTADFGVGLRFQDPRDVRPGGPLLVGPLLQQVDGALDRPA